MADEVAKLTVKIVGDTAELEASIKGIENELGKLGKSSFGNKSGESLKKTEKAALSFGDSLKKSGKDLQEYGEAIDNATKPLQKTALGLAAGGVAAAKLAIDFEDNFAAVKKTVDGTPEQLEKVKKGIIDLTTVGINGRNPLAMSTAELTELAAAGGQLGISTDNLVEFTEVMAQMGVATNLAGEEGAAAMARFRNVMQIPETEIRNMGSTIVDLGNNMATTEAEIIEMSNRMGKYGQTVGMGAADVMGYSAALSSLGVEAQLGGSAVGRTWLSIEKAVAKGGDELTAFAKYSGKSAADFQKQWGEDASGAFESLLKGLGEADNLTLALSEVGINNTQDIQAIMAMATNYELVAEALRRANAAWGENTALQAEADAKMETTASKMQIAINNITEAGRSLGEVTLPIIAECAGDVAEVAQKFASLDESTQKGIMKFGATMIGLGATSKVISSTVKSVGKIKSGFGLVIKNLPKIKAIGSVIAAGITTPVGAAALAVTGLGIAAKIAYDKWYASEYKWADGMNEQAEEINKTVSELDKLSGLKNELAGLELVINNPNSSKEEVEGAKQRLEEIKTLLAEEYNLTVKADTTELEEAVEKVETLKRSELAEQVNEIMPSVTDNAGKYASQKSELAGHKSTQKELEKELELLDDYIQKSRTIENIYKNKDGDFKGNNEKEIAESRLKYAEKMSELYSEWLKAGGGKIDELDKIDPYDDFATTTISRWEDFLNGRKMTDEMSLDYVKSEIDKLTAVKNEYEKSVEKLNSALTDKLALDVDFGSDFDVETDVEQLKQVGIAMEEAGISTHSFISDVAAASMGYKEFDKAIADGKAPEMASQYIDFGQAIGMTAENAAAGAALLKNGFNDVGKAVEAGDGAIAAVIKDMQSLAESQGIEVTADKLSEMAQALGLIPKSTRIEITAEGNVEFINDAQELIDKINAGNNVELKIDTQGNITLLETADEELKKLAENRELTFKLNAEGNGLDIFDGNSKLNRMINGDGQVVKINADTTPGKKEIANLNNEPVKVKVTADTTAADSKIKSLNQTVTVKVKTVEPAPTPDYRAKATGTSYFQGGLAMVNDQKGAADPRELIVDNGRAFIPSGRNVILPLSKGAKVYTASQTKEIMKGLGIPRFAKGKDNSDAFTAARDAYSHYTKTHAVTVAEELEKWVEFSKKFKSNIKDVEDIEEQIFSLMKRQNQELNDISSEYIKLHSQLNDWDKTGDNPIAAFNRVKERNLAEFNAGRLTWDEYSSANQELADDMLDARIDQSKDWLERQKKYYGMNTQEYIAGIDRMLAYSYEYYEKLGISEAKYHEIYTKLIDERMDAEKELAEERAEQSEKLVESWENSADNWYKIRETFNDWEKMNDSKSQYYIRRIARYEQMFRSGDIDWQTYMDSSMDDYLNMYKAEEERIDAELEEFRKVIDETESKFRDEEAALRDSWTVEDREDDLDEVNRLLGIYENAVTDTGMQKYKELLEEKKQLEREEELYDLEQEHNEEIEDLEAEYKRMERDKEKILKKLRTNSFNIFQSVEDVNSSVTAVGEAAGELAQEMKSNSNVTNAVLLQLVQTLNKLANRPTNVYNDGRTLNIAGHYDSDIVGMIGKSLGSSLN